MQDTTVVKTTPKDFFLYIGMIVALYVSAVSMLTVAFQAINTLFPDVLDYTYSNASALRAGVSALVVGFPIYILLSRAIYREFATFPEKRDLWIRRWLIYLTLFIAGITLAVNIIILVNTFLEGEITTRFVLKALSVAVVASAIFRYYLFDLRRDMVATASLVRQLAWGAGAVVLASLVGGVLIVGTPTSQRLVRFDERRVSDLSNIQYQVVNYWQRKAALPIDLAALNDPISGFSAPVDAETGAAYAYRVTGARSFELCATFQTSSKSDTKDSRYPAAYPIGLEGQDNWQHDAGRDCFERTIDPELYPPTSTELPPVGPLPPVKPMPIGR